jgi:hypothetical protein
VAAVEDGVSVRIVKRRGPAHEIPLHIRVDEYPEHETALPYDESGGGRKRDGGNNLPPKLRAVWD